MLAKYVEGTWGDTLSLTIVYQHGDGINNALLSAKDLLPKDQPFILAYGDIVVKERAYIRTLETYINSGADATILVSPKLDIESYGVAYISGNRITHVKEKPSPEKAESTLAIAGIFVLPSKIFNLIEEHGFTKALNILATKYSVTSCLWGDWWIDIGYPWDILEANRNVLRNLSSTYISNKANISSKAIIEGPVYIDEYVHIDHNAIIKGPVYIGRNVFVGANSFIRKFTSIEEEAVIGAYTEIKESSLQPKVTVSSFSYIGNSIIGSNTTVGPHCTTLNVLPSGVKVSRLHPIKIKGKLLTKLGAIIGCNARIGAQTVIYAGTVIRSNELVPPQSIIANKELSL